MIKRETNGGQSIEEFDIAEYVTIYSLLDDISAKMKSIDAYTNVGVTYLKTKVDATLKKRLVNLGCPHDLSDEVVEGLTMDYMDL